MKEIELLIDSKKVKGEIVLEKDGFLYIVLESGRKIKLSDNSPKIMNRKNLMDNLSNEYINSLTIKQLEEEIKEAKENYYNKTPQITDDSFDRLEDRLKKLDSKNKLLKQVGAKVEKNKVKLPFYMPSLDKLKPDTVEKWLARHKGPYVISVKLDGISVLLHSVKNEWKLYTRGDGSIGQDISYLSKYLRIPEPSSEVAIRAELIMPIAEFKKLEGENANPRNLVSGLVNRKDIDIHATKKIDVVCYEVILPELKPSEQFKFLKSKGFNVSPNKTFENLILNDLSDLLMEWKSSSKYDMDGLVISLDKKYSRTTDGNPDYMVAFKQLLDSQTVTVRVVEVEWNLSKHGFLKPTVIIESV